MPDCKHCPKRNGRVDMQYDCYCMSNSCPYDECKECAESKEEEEKI